MTPAPSPSPSAPRRRASRTGRAGLIIGVVLLSAVALAALISLFWLPYPVDDTSGGRLEGASWQHWLGTDRLGHDIATRVLIGARIALTVGAGAALIASIIGISFGLLAALSRGWFDDVASSILDVLIAFPTLLLAMLMVAVGGASLLTVTVAIGLSASAVIARLTRILTSRVLREQYVVAARTSGVGTLGIVWHHVLPNIWPFLIVNVAVLFGSAVLAEAGLSYLGLGTPPPNASWGRLLLDAQATFTTQPLGAIAPGVAIVVLVIGANLLSDGLRAVVDPTQQEAA